MATCMTCTRLNWLSPHETNPQQCLVVLTVHSEVRHSSTPERIGKIPDYRVAPNMRISYRRGRTETML